MFDQKFLKGSKDVELLNQVLRNNFEEFDETVANRNTYIEDGNVVRWVDNFPYAPEKVILRKCTDREVTIWNAYKALLSAVIEKGE